VRRSTRFAGSFNRPGFRQADDRGNEVRLTGPSATSLLGGATVRIWTTVTNPNPFGFTVSTINGELYVDDRRAAEGDFPLGLALRPDEESTIPIDFTIRFQDIPGLATAIRQAASGGSVPYRLDGTIGVEAGRLGNPTFGPLTLLTGELRRPRSIGSSGFPGNSRIRAFRSSHPRIFAFLD
jgi:hypothetical protein